jgi:hypothetical protein
MRWPENWAPPHVVAWHLLWLVPWYAVRVVLCVVALCAFGPAGARQAWKGTS